MKTTKNSTYCDNCGDVIFKNRKKPLMNFREFTELPAAVESAKKGESAIVCERCCFVLELYPRLNDVVTKIVIELNNG